LSNFAASTDTATVGSSVLADDTELMLSPANDSEIFDAAGDGDTADSSKALSDALTPVPTLVSHLRQYSAEASQTRWMIQDPSVDEAT
jgi:hypothetical protein